jgi:hypothetical protein
VIPIYTFVTDSESYSEMRRSFGAAGFTEDRASFVELRSTGRPDEPEPFTTISQLIVERPEPYVILCHQDVRLDQGDGLREFLDAIGELETLDPRWALAGDAGGSAQLTLVRSVTDPHGAPSNHRLPAKVDSLDENFLVIRCGTGVSCSAELSGFHFYGADVCLNAHLLGRTAYVVDFHVRHLSAGARPPTYIEARERFVDRWSREFEARYFRSSTDVHFFSKSPFLRRTLGTLRLRRVLKNHRVVARVTMLVMSVPLGRLRR